MRFANGAPYYIDERVLCHSVVADERLCEGARSHLMRYGVLWSKPRERRSARTTGNPDPAPLRFKVLVVVGVGRTVIVGPVEADYFEAPA